MDPGSVMAIEAIKTAAGLVSGTELRHIPTPILSLALRQLLDASVVLSDELDSRTLP